MLISQPDADLDAPWEALIFAELLFLALLIFSHIGRANPLGAARAGQGGGLVGWAGSELLVGVMGVTAARVLTFVVAIGAGVGVVYGLRKSALAQPAEPISLPTLAIPAGVSFRPFLATASTRRRGHGRRSGATRQAARRVGNLVATG